MWPETSYKASRSASSSISFRSYSKVYGDEAQFTKQNDKFTALMFSFTLHRQKGAGAETALLVK